jgi:hypothetical protein
MLTSTFLSFGTTRPATRRGFDCTYTKLGFLWVKVGEHVRERNCITDTYGCLNATFVLLKFAFQRSDIQRATCYP